MRKSLVLLTLLSCLCLPEGAVAQTPNLPRITDAPVYLGSFAVPLVDRQSVALDYGGYALGMGADGTSLYIGCHDYTDQLARVSIPAIGGVATILEDCTTIPNVQEIVPGTNKAVLANGLQLGGTLIWNNRVIVTAFTNYDNAADGPGGMQLSHFGGSTIATLAGPRKVSDSVNTPVGMTGGYMGIVPPEWRTAVGGPALTGLCCISILSRTSYGPSAHAFDPDLVVAGSGLVPSVALVGYPDAHQTLGAYDADNPYYNSAWSVGGVAWPNNTKSVYFVANAPKGPYCYGVGDPVQANHNVVINGELHCYDPLNSNKGPHGYPYGPVLLEYDATDFAAAKAGTKQYWQVVPVAKIDLPGGVTAARITSATFNPTTGEIWATFFYNNLPRVHGWRVGSVVAPPPPVSPTGTLTATPSTVSAGQSFSLTWTTANATTAAIDKGVGALTPVAGGSKTLVSPNATTTYTLTATGAGGTAVVRTTVEVTGASASTCVSDPLSVSVTAWPGIGEGSRTGSFTWSVAGATVTWKEYRFVVANGRANSFVLTDSRGCTTTVFRP
jgi:hypothetical protein